MNKLPATPSKQNQVLFRLLLLILSAAGGGLGFLSLAGRLPGFWLLSRWPKAFLLCAGAGLIAILFGWALRAVWIRLGQPGRWRIWTGLLAALCAGVLLKLLLPVPAVPMMHVLEIETTGSGRVDLLEVRGANGRIVPFAEFQVVGGWQRVQEGLTVTGGETASLRYSFYAPGKGKLALLFYEQPGGGEVLVRLNGQEQQIDLSSQSDGLRKFELSFQKRSPWDLPLMLADVAALYFVLPVLLFATGSLAAPAVQGAWGLARQPALHLDYNSLWIALFVALSVVPLVGFRGEWGAIDKEFFGYNQLYQLYSFIRHDIFHDQVFDQVIVGPGDWLVLGDQQSMDDYQYANLYTDEQLFQLQQRIDSTSAYLQRRGIRFLVVVTPNKNTIYPQYVPAQISHIGEQSRLDQFLAYQKEHGQTQVVEMRSALLQARPEHSLFYRTDTHWNPYGAYLGYASIAAALQDQFPALAPHPLDAYDYTVDSVHLGDLGNGWVQSSPPETFFQLQPTFPRKIARFELLEERHLYSFRYNNSGFDGLPTAVIYHDSSMSWIAPFLADHFRKGTFIWSEKLDLNYIESEHPDIVIYQCTERFLDNLFALPVVNE